MNPNEHDKIFRLSQVPQQIEALRHNSQLLHELKARQVELENKNEDLKQIAATLRDLTKRYSDHYELAPNGYFTINGHGIIQELNLRSCSYLKISRSKALGTAFTDYLVEEDLPIFLQHLQMTLLGNDAVTCELRLRTTTGEIFEGEMVSASGRNDKDGMLIIRSSLQDISRRKRMEADLKNARDKAESVSTEKSKFLANMSHEMRTPLGVVIGFTDMLLDSPSPDDLQRGLKTIQRNSLHLLNLIDDLLDLAKIESGKMVMENLPFDLKVEMEAIVEQFTQKAKCKGLSLKWSALNELPIPIHTDPVRVRQIILNVLSNALKFTDAGSIVIEVSFQRATGSLLNHKSLINIDVIDTGCGIKADRVNILFEPFSQAEASTSRRFGGTGLGLCLSRRFAEALGGDLVLLRTQEGVGSVFRITIDPHLSDLSISNMNSKSEDTAPLMQYRELPSLTGIKILVVEDGLDSQLLIKKLLESVGAIVDCAEDGEEAMRCIGAATFDVILMDIQLPVMDGFEATFRLRQKGCITPIIALTAHALNEDRLRAEAVGCDDFISKPIDWPRLAEAIVRCRNASFH